MNQLTVLLVLFFASNAFAKDCPSRYLDEVNYMLASDGLGNIDKTGKLEKFTHHDYSISCDIKIKNRNFKWYTDEVDTRFLLAETINSEVVYYGLFHLKNT